uniref:Uncharacterized protein n=1 Tax=Oryza meridionalis TaxID=40149 RepID=A0A0E0DQ59_9ORYZ
MPDREHLHGEREAAGRVGAEPGSGAHLRRHRQGAEVQHAGGGGGDGRLLLGPHRAGVVGERAPLHHVLAAVARLLRRHVPVAALLPVPFAEKAIVALFRIAVRLLSGAGGGDRMAEELVFKSGYSDPGNAWSSSSSSSSSSSVVAAAATMMMMEDASRMGNLATSMFIKLAEALRKTSLVQQEEVRNQRRYGTSPHLPHAAVRLGRRREVAGTSPHLPRPLPC